MARINAKGYLSGAVGPVYFRVLNGKPIVQSKPGKGKVKQAAATKAGASEFGAASSIAKNIRIALFPILQGMGDKNMFRRFTAVVYDAVKANTNLETGKRRLADGDLSILEGFEFNSNSLSAKYTALSPQVVYGDDGKVVVSLSETTFAEAFRIIPPKASRVEFRVLVTVTDKHSGMFVKQEDFSISATISEALIQAQVWTTGVLPTDHLVLVTAAVYYYREDRLAGSIPLNNEMLHPCRMVGAFLTQ